MKLMLNFWSNIVAIHWRKLWRMEELSHKELLGDMVIELNIACDVELLE